MHTINIKKRKYRYIVPLEVAHRGIDILAKYFPNYSIRYFPVGDPNDSMYIVGTTLSSITVKTNTSYIFILYDGTEFIWQAPSSEKWYTGTVDELVNVIKNNE